MPEHPSTRTAKGLLTIAGHQPRFYVPGSLCILIGGTMTWTERCGARCKHDDHGCHVARSGRVPTGRINDGTPPASPSTPVVADAHPDQQPDSEVTGP